MLDTHAFLWWDTEPEKLSAKAYAACMEPGNRLPLSHASIWEMQIKVQNGRLKLRLPLAGLIRDHQSRNGLVLEPIDLPDILRLDALSFHHRDPFDRMIIAQTIQRGGHLVTLDGLIEPYGVPLMGEGQQVWLLTQTIP